MALVNVQHKAVTGRARQFDGTLGAFTDILSGRPLANARATTTFDQAGAFVAMTVSGGAFGNVAVAVNDWVVFPTDTTLLPISVPAAQAATDWQVV